MDLLMQRTNIVKILDVYKSFHYFLLLFRKARNKVRHWFASTIIFLITLQSNI